MTLNFFKMRILCIFIMKIDYQQVIDRANIIYKNKIEEKYKKKYPNLDMNEVNLDLSEESVSLLQALIEEINQYK